MRSPWGASSCSLALGMLCLLLSLASVAYEEQQLMNLSLLTYAPMVTVLCCRACVMVPCGHMITCRGCSDAIMARDKLCPICREGIQIAMDVFL